MFDNLTLAISIAVVAFLVFIVLLHSFKREGFLRHFPRQSSLSYIIGTPRANDHERPWHSYRLTWCHNKPIDNADRDNYRTKREWAVEWSSLRRGRSSGKLQPGFGLGWHVTRGDGGDADLDISLYFGRLLSVWFHFSGPWLKKICAVSKKRDPKYYWEGRDYRLTFFDGVSKFRFNWGTLPNHWGQDTPGFELSSSSWPRFFLGHTEMIRENLRGGKIGVPLPEGVYFGTWKEDRVRWLRTRPLGKLLNKIKEPKWRYDWQIDIPDGIPVQGKGENSYDCGMDGIWSLSTGPQRSPEALVGALVGSILEGRRSYGGPHDLPYAMTVKQAEDWYKARSA